MSRVFPIPVFFARCPRCQSKRITASSWSPDLIDFGNPVHCNSCSLRGHLAKGSEERAVVVWESFDEGVVKAPADSLEKPAIKITNDQENEAALEQLEALVKEIEAYEKEAYPGGRPQPTLSKRLVRSLFGGFLIGALVSGAFFLGLCLGLGMRG